MPEIKEFQYGYDASGVEKFINELKDAIDKANEKVKNVKPVQDFCDRNWEGQAKENFNKNIELTAEYVVTQINALYKALSAELYSLQNAMGDKDASLLENN